MVQEAAAASEAALFRVTHLCERAAVVVGMEGVVFSGRDAVARASFLTLELSAEGFVAILFAFVGGGSASPWSALTLTLVKGMTTVGLLSFFVGFFTASFTSCFTVPFVSVVEVCNSGGKSSPFRL